MVASNSRAHRIISISGDGSFGQYAMEFTTAVKYGMDIPHILLNQAQLGKITKEQRGGEWPVWQTELQNPSFGAFARLRGELGARVTEIQDVEDALRQAPQSKGPSLVEIISDPELI